MHCNRDDFTIPLDVVSMCDVNLLNVSSISTGPLPVYTPRHSLMGSMSEWAVEAMDAIEAVKGRGGMGRAACFVWKAGIQHGG